jgi:hypothetical protein
MLPGFLNPLNPVKIAPITFVPVQKEYGSSQFHIICEEPGARRGHPLDFWPPGGPRVASEKDCARNSISHVNTRSARSCYFTSYQQCMTTISGIGGYCYQNPSYRGSTSAYGQMSTARRVGPVRELRGSACTSQISGGLSPSPGAERQRRLAA